MNIKKKKSYRLFGEWRESLYVQNHCNRWLSIHGLTTSEHIMVIHWNLFLPWQNIAHYQFETISHIKYTPVCKWRQDILLFCAWKYAPETRLGCSFTWIFIYKYFFLFFFEWQNALNRPPDALLVPRKYWVLFYSCQNTQ